ncbi:MAG TPA: hypothetical protein DC057_05210 [Spirochaetia bacterium]|nr:hypothetical protein [Spirochaetia bacterium]
MTTITDNFNRNNNTNLNASNDGKTFNGQSGSWMWTEVNGDCLIESNSVRSNSNNINSFIRAEVDFSSSHHSQFVIISSSTSSSISTCIRAISGSNFSCYGFMIKNQFASSSYNLIKVINGSIINLTAPVYFTLTPPDTIRISAVNTGSVVKIGGHLNGMLKQTFIDSSSVFNYTKTGIHFLGFTNSWSYADNFESSDEPGTR